jgi:carbon storage regulator CsrA
MAGHGEARRGLAWQARHGKQVRLGINAPREIPVHRCEVYAAIESGECRQMKSV